jgi:hypothetical protein
MKSKAHEYWNRRYQAPGPAIEALIEAANDLSEDILGNSESIDDAGSYDIHFLLKLRAALAAFDAAQPLREHD